MSPLKGACILFSEDEVLINISTTDQLETLGCQVTSAVHLDEAWQAVHLKLPDAAILDVNIGIRTSFELAEWLEARNVPVIFMTGYDYPAEVGRRRDHPRCHKPCKPQEIAALLTMVLRRDLPENRGG